MDIIEKYIREAIKSIMIMIAIVSITSCDKNEIKNPISDLDTVVYTSSKYSIFSNSVVDSIYGGFESPAIIPNDTTIYSPVRIIPEGKTVVLNNTNVWHPSSDLKKYPSLHTKHASINATYNLALDILYRCSSGEFMRNEGEEGMWQAGYRRGEGYGVWNRDVCYTSLWMGAFLDKNVAKKSIEYVTANGIDNGEDGLALPAIAVWNYFIITGDTSVIRNSYNNLKTQVQKIQYNENKNLGFAKAGSFLDSRPQPEPGGYPLSTNILYMEAYGAMALMGKIMNESRENIELWNDRNKIMKETINREYWNPKYGYYTFGPQGTVSYEKGHWENLGQTLAIWPQWRISDQAKINSVLDNRQNAYNSYGFTDLNYTEFSNNNPRSPHGLQVWIFTEVGEVAAMVHEKRMDDLLEMLASVIRTATIHKTFQECINWKTGKAWRYDGQLWHAMGFISMIQYGVLGMEYNEEGLTFSNACVPKPLANLRLDNFLYRDAVFDIKVNGWGFFDKLLLDGKQVDHIDSKIIGEHVIEIILKKT